jgi:hypothetical protein
VRDQSDQPSICQENSHPGRPGSTYSDMRVDVTGEGVWHAENL